jgi:hypothetical protein
MVSLNAIYLSILLVFMRIIYDFANWNYRLIFLYALIIIMRCRAIGEFENWALLCMIFGCRVIIPITHV